MVIITLSHGLTNYSHSMNTLANLLQPEKLLSPAQWKDMYGLKDTVDTSAISKKCLSDLQTIMSDLYTGEEYAIKCEEQLSMQYSIIFL